MASQKSTRSLQSLCLMDPKELVLLTATRSGEILEMRLQKQSIKGREIEERSLLRFNGGDGSQGRGKILMTHHPKL